MNVWSIVDDESPDYEPQTAEGPEHVEDRLPAPVLAQVSRGGHGDDSPERPPRTDKGGEPGNVGNGNIYGIMVTIMEFKISNLILTCFSPEVRPSGQSLRI